MLASVRLMAEVSPLPHGPGDLVHVAAKRKWRTDRRRMARLQLVTVLVDFEQANAPNLPLVGMAYGKSD